MNKEKVTIPKNFLLIVNTSVYDFTFGEVLESASYTMELFEGNWLKYGFGGITFFVPEACMSTDLTSFFTP